MHILIHLLIHADFLSLSFAASPYTKGNLVFFFLS